MAASLELRSPFLDHHVVELGLALPPALARGQDGPRKAFAGTLPPDTLHGPKTGFGVPLDRWFRDELRDHSDDLLLGGPDRGLFRTRRARAAAPRAPGPRRRPRAPALVPVCLELWQRTYVDSATALTSHL